MFTTTSNLNLSCRAKKLNPFVNSFKSMISAFCKDFDGLSIRESLDQQSVKLQNKNDLSFPLSDDLCLKRQMSSLVLSPEKRRGGRGVVEHSREPVLLGELPLLTAAVS